LLKAEGIMFDPDETIRLFFFMVRDLYMGNKPDSNEEAL